MVDVNSKDAASRSLETIQRQSSGDPAKPPRWDIIELLFFAYRDFVGDPDDVLDQFGLVHKRFPLRICLTGIR